MNIALVLLQPPPGAGLGGPRIFVDALARALSKVGHRVTVYVRRDAASLLRPGAVPGPTVVSLDVGQTREEFALGLSEAWGFDPPDVVHAFGLASGMAALAAVRVAGGPALVQTFQPLAQVGHRSNGVLDDQAVLVRAAARIIAPSSAHVFALLGMGASPAVIKFVPCGVDLDAFAPAAREARPPGRLRIATLGGLEPGDGVADVIEALEFSPGTELVIGGGPSAGAEILAQPAAVRLQALAQARGVADRVVFRGHIERSEVPAFLRAADIVVCAQHDDSMGMVALEAMACGVPLIVSAVGGLVDAVVDGLTGLHVPARAPRQIAYAIETLRADETRRERFGRFGTERTTARFGWGRIGRDTAEIYVSVAKRDARGTLAKSYF